MYYESLLNEKGAVYCHYYKNKIGCSGGNCEYYMPDYKLKEKVSELKNNPPINNEKLFHYPFSFRGRIGRIEYLLSFMLCCALYFLSQLFIPIIEGLIIMIYLWFWIAQSVKRCHDVGNSGFYILIPFYILWLLCIAGDEDINEYGSEPMKKYHEQIEEIIPDVTNSFESRTVDTSDNMGTENEHRDTTKLALHAEKVQEIKKADPIMDIYETQNDTDKNEIEDNFKEGILIRYFSFARKAVKNGQMRSTQDVPEKNHEQINDIAGGYCSNIINHYFPFHKGYRRLLLVSWLLSSFIVGVSQRYQGNKLVYGLFTLIGLLLAYFIAFWIYSGFQEEHQNEEGNGCK